MLFSGNIGSTNYARYKSSVDRRPVQPVLRRDPVRSRSRSSTRSRRSWSSDIPFIPVTEGVDWYQYDTTHFGGWPTQSNPYAQPRRIASPDNGMVLTHLYPVELRQQASMRLRVRRV